MLFSVLYITLDEHPLPQTSFTVLDLLGPERETRISVCSFHKCNITLKKKVLKHLKCNIHFDADREITSGTGGDGQRRGIALRETGGMIFIYYFFLSCNSNFIMLLSFSLAPVYFLGGRGCIILN